MLGSDPSELKAQGHQGAAAAHEGLQSAFNAAALGEPLDAAKISAAGAAVVNEIQSKGLASWVDAVRQHHSQTYQHCLLVTGVTTAFGQHLGLRAVDRTRLAFAGMLHDVGKALIPVSILEKPGPLGADEMAIMKKHPEYGLQALECGSNLQAEMVDIVIHHHEYLDGSGYPHGLRASEISDLVRITTICDIYSALIEHRSYKAPLTSKRAYELLLEMGAKLDKDLVREFSFVLKAA